jgi:O-antigen/teichoic acid export membrane protein
MSIKRNFIFNFLLMGSNLFFPLISFPYLSRIIGAEGLGACNFMLSYCQNYIILAALGLPVYGVREISRCGDDKTKRSKLFFELLSINLIFTIFLLVIYFVSVFFLSDFKDYRQLSLLGGLYILLNVFSIEWMFSGVSDFKYITIRSIIIRTLSVLSIFIFVKNRVDIVIYFLILVGTLLITVVINLNYSRKYLTKNFDYSALNIFSHVKPVSLLGIYMVLTSIYTILPLTLLGFFSTKASVGYYYGANKIIRMIVTFFSALTTVMIPKLNVIVENKETDNYISLIHKSLNFVICLGIPIAFGVYLLAEPIILLLAGREFYSSIFCLRLMAPVILFIAFAQIFVILILSVNRGDKEMVFLSIIGMIISSLINVIFIPKYSERATAFSQFSAELLVTILSFFLARRFTYFKFPVRLFLLNVVFVIPFALIIHLCMRVTNNNFMILFFSGLSCLLYFIFYQFLIIRDGFFTGLFEPYLEKFKRAVSH